MQKASQYLIASYFVVLTCYSLLVFNSSILSTQSLSGAGFLLAALLVASSAFFVLRSNLSSKSFFLICLFTTTAIFYSNSLYFFWDEWHALGRFAYYGFSSVLRSHNEHFLPVFFSLYYAEAFAFGDSYFPYLFVGYLVHAVNACLLRTFLFELSPGLNRKTITVVSFLWLISALHSEVLHWAFTTAVSLSTMFVLLAMFLTLRFLTFEKWRDGGLAVLFGIVAPLCFGNGFVVVGYLAFISLVCLFRKKTDVKTIFKLIFPLLLGLGVVAFCYWYFRKGGGHGVDAAAFSHSLLDVVEIVIIGWGFGTTLRGLGLYADLSPIVDTQYLPTRLLQHVSAELVYAYCGLGLLLIGGLFLYKKRHSLDTFILGNAIIAVSYVLPAFGRAELGLSSGLFLRYTYVALLGLVIAIVPVIAVLSSRDSRLLKFIGYSCFVAYFSTQLFMTSNANYFREQGVKNQEFIASLIDWQEKLCESGTTIKKSYEGKNTPYVGKYPVMGETLTPGRHPTDIYKILLWLNSDLLDLDCKKH